jgi:predicted DCC family thiol-disulfide oxidoreductase YuxK
MLIFDGDCGFCSTCIRVAQRLLPGHVPAVPWQRVPDLAAYGLTAEEAAASLQWIDSSGSLASGHEAVAQLLINAGGPWAVLGRILLLPLVRDAAAGVYRFVARHRHQFPGGTPACQLPEPEKFSDSGVT